MINECINIDKLEPMDLLPRWCYINSEWNDIVNQTVRIIDNIRYIEKNPEQQLIDELEDFADEFLI